MQIDELSPDALFSLTRAVRKIVGKAEPEKWTPKQREKLREAMKVAGLTA